MKLSSIFAVVACAVVAQASSVSDALTDISSISSHVNDFGKHVEAFSNGGGLASAVAMKSSVNSLVESINTATTTVNNVTPLPVSLADSTSVMTAMNNLKPDIITSLDNLVAAKKAIHAPLSNSMFKRELDTLSIAVKNLQGALMEKTPSSLQASATSLGNVINSAIASAIAAYY